MIERILLVDYENIQAVDLSSLPADVKVRFVLGGKQAKLPSELAIHAHALGDRLYGIRLDTPSERGRVTADLVKEVRARLDLRDPGDSPDAERARPVVLPLGHQVSSAARSSAARAMPAVAARSRMYSGRTRTSIPASAGSAAAALSSSSTSQPSMSPAP